MSSIQNHAHDNLNITQYAIGSDVIDCGAFPGIMCPYEHQYILRMLIKKPNNEFRIPLELSWLESMIMTAYNTNISLGIPTDNRFVYVTIRHGEVSSTTDDEWHVDGFSMRIPHVPEQNYLWCSAHGTEYINGGIAIPFDFDPFKHNIHLFFQDNINNHEITTCEPLHMYIIDPYVIHRRPKLPIGTKRTFVRISFVPIEIEDDTCTKNPLIFTPKYNRDDIRNTLTRYPL